MVTPLIFISAAKQDAESFPQPVFWCGVSFATNY